MANSPRTCSATSAASTTATSNASRPRRLEANYKGSDHIGKTGLEQSYERELHGATGYEQVEVDAGGRGVRTLSRTAPTSGNNLVLTLDLQLQEVAEAGVRREPRRAGGDRTGHGRRARLRVQTRLRPEPVCRRHRSGQLGTAQQFARPAAQQPRAHRPVSARLHLQALHGARRARTRQAHHLADDLRPRLLHVRRPSLPRRQGRRPRHRRHVQIDRRVLRHLLLHARQRPGHRQHLRLSSASSASARAPASTSRARRSACCHRRNGR